MWFSVSCVRVCLFSGLLGWCRSVLRMWFLERVRLIFWLLICVMLCVRFSDRLFSCICVLGCVGWVCCSMVCSCVVSLCGL